MYRKLFQLRNFSGYLTGKENLLISALTNLEIKKGDLDGNIKT
ncbi:hypothetical protein FB550_102204 [Neobacillus bataviensis]|uniref:Uncharacterized protein n=1 Tax=Neobacillus bataviensis TaxID=220685 RepID=A0A561DS45_9BACI|nr:hypothetical protein FB550_102204 [Neobacillus bataviensis]